MLHSRIMVISMMTKTLYWSKVAEDDAADFPELHRLLGSTWESCPFAPFRQFIPSQVARTPILPVGCSTCWRINIYIGVPLSRSSFLLFKTSAYPKLLQGQR